MQQKKTLVLGASENPARYSCLAMKRLNKNGHPVVAIGRKNGIVDGIQIETEKIAWKDIDTVTLYLNAAHQKEFYHYIISLHPNRIIFNPGSENDELAELALQQGINTVDACTLVLLSTSQF